MTKGWYLIYFNKRFLKKAGEFIDPITRIPVISVQECRAVCRTLFTLKSLWNGFGKDPAYPYFYTLGAASYLDGNQPDVYASKVKKSNEVMQSQFADLYYQLKQALAAFLEFESSQLIFEPDVALPCSLI